MGSEYGEGLVRRGTRPRRRPHPVLYGVGAVMWAATVYLAHSVVAEAVLFTVVLASMALASSEVGTMWRYLIWSLPLMAIYAMVSSVFGQAGGWVLWKGPHIPALGRLMLTTDSLRDGLYRAFRLWNLLGCLMVLFRNLQADDIVYWLGKHFSRVGLTLSMILGFIPGMLAERRRIAENVRLRGAVGHDSGKRAHLRAQAAVYQTLLMNALERSWRLAESMYVRGYGSRSRTLYARPVWSLKDVRLVMASLLALGLNAWILGLAGNFVHVWLDRTAWSWGAMAATGICWIWMGVRIRGRHSGFTSHLHVSGVPSTGTSRRLS